MQPRDITGAVRDILGNPVSKGHRGAVWDHVKEVNEGLDSLSNVLNGLKAELGNLALSAADRDRISKAISQLSKQKDKIEDTLAAARKEAKDKNRTAAKGVNKSERSRDRGGEGPSGKKNEDE